MQLDPGMLQGCQTTPTTASGSKACSALCRIAGQSQTLTCFLHEVLIHSHNPLHGGGSISVETGREDQGAVCPAGLPTEHSPADQQTPSPISEKQSCIWPVLLSADHTSASTFQLSHRPPHFSQSLALFPQLCWEPHHPMSAVFPRQEHNTSSQLGKLPTSALYLQPLNLAPAVQAQALSPTSIMTLPPALAPIPTQHTAPSDPGAEMQS